MCSSSEAGSYLRLIDFVYLSTLSLRVIKKKRRRRHHANATDLPSCANINKKCSLETQKEDEGGDPLASEHLVCPQERSERLPLLLVPTELPLLHFPAPSDLLAGFPIYWQGFRGC